MYFCSQTLLYLPNKLRFFIGNQPKLLKTTNKSKKARKKPKITNESRKIFTEYYLDDICKLEELLSINLSEWKKQDQSQ